MEYLSRRSLAHYVQDELLSEEKHECNISDGDEWSVAPAVRLGFSMTMSHSICFFTFAKMLLSFFNRYYGFGDALCIVALIIVVVLNTLIAEHNKYSQFLCSLGVQ